MDITEKENTLVDTETTTNAKAKKEKKDMGTTVKTESVIETKTPEKVSETVKETIKETIQEKMPETSGWNWKKISGAMAALVVSFAGGYYVAQKRKILTGSSSTATTAEDII